MRQRASIAVGLVAIVWALGPGRAGAGDVRFVDGVIAEIDGVVISASEIALARALGLFGLRPGPGPLEAAAVERYVNGRLLVREALRLGLQATDSARAEAWAAVVARAGGRAALDAWLSRADIEAAWAHRLADEDLLGRRFVALRFRDLAFVSEDEVSAALGPGAHGAAARDAARERLEDEAARRRLDAWLAESPARAAIGRFGAGGAPVPNPLPVASWQH